MAVSFEFNAGMALHDVVLTLKVAINLALTQLAKYRRIFLLQGLVGLFFDRLAQWLARDGVE